MERAWVRGCREACGGGYNLVPRACDPREGTRGSGIIRCRKPGIVAKIELRIHFNGQSDSSLKRIIPEPRVPSRGSQARRTILRRLGPISFPEPATKDRRLGERDWVGHTHFQSLSFIVSHKIFHLPFMVPIIVR